MFRSTPKCGRLRHLKQNRADSSSGAFASGPPEPLTNRASGKDVLYKSMIKTDLKAVLERVSTWPEERQRQLAELALEIEAEMSESAYQATSEELAAIDEGLAGDAASQEEVDAAFASFRRI